MMKNNRNGEHAGFESIETASIDEIRALQLERLKATLAHVYTNSAVYKKKFDDAGVHPDDLKSLDDLSRFPYTTKADLRDNYPFGMFCVPQKEVVRVHASSGTTGKPTVVGYTHNDIETWTKLMARSIYAAGGRPGDKVHVAYGYGLFTGGLGAHYGAERLGCTVIPIGTGQTEKQIQLIQDFEPDIIMVTPSYMLNLADAMEKQGINPVDTSLRIGIFGAEPWTNAMRQDMEQRLGIDAIDIYGLSEVIGPGVAQECIETKDGLTLWEDHFYPEIINPETGEVLPDGEIGELVFTSLTKEAMPVIRYRTRDLTRLLPGTARSMRRIDKITARTDDMLIIRGVNVYPTQIEEQIVKTEELTSHYMIEVAKNGSLDTMKVSVEESGGNSPEKNQKLASTLQHRIKAYIGVSVAVDIVEPGKLPRSEGKAKRVVDTRNS